jgi:chloramphenicol O-acetyltransferase type A
MKTKIELSTWPRREHFEFFNRFEEPFWSVCVNVDCSNAYKNAKDAGLSFFLYYLHCSLTAANQLEHFRYRIAGDGVHVYDDVHASATVGRPNGTFGFSYIEYHADLKKFVSGAKAEIDRVQASTALMPPKMTDNVIHYSALPWLNFTGLTHARSFTFKDSVPKISFGKVTETAGRKMMPVSITVHHGLMDGLHVGQYVDLLQELLNG